LNEHYFSSSVNVSAMRDVVFIAGGRSDYTRAESYLKESVGVGVSIFFID